MTLLVSVFLLLIVSREINYRLHQNEAGALKSPLFVSVSEPGEEIVIFIHGLTGSHRYWNQIRESLPKKYQIVAVDLLGFGRSPWPRIDYTLEQHLVALDQTLNQFVGSGKKVSLVGHSMGALLALQYFRRHPEALDKIILLAPPLYESRADLMQRLQKSSIFVAAMSADPFVSSVLCHLHEILGPLSVFIFRPFMKSLPPEVVEDVTLHTWQSFNGSLKNIVATDKFDELIQNLPGQKVLAVFGDEDVHNNLEKIKSQQRAGIFKIQFVPGGHNFPVERSKETAGLVETFLQKSAQDF